jgi:hypothetical protein
MEGSDRLLEQADALGLDASLCPVRAMVPAFLNGEHFPAPDLLICSAGAICDDFSTIAQRLEHLGYPILWWEIPRRRSPRPGEPGCSLPGGAGAAQVQVMGVAAELERIGIALGRLAGTTLTLEALAMSIQRANLVRQLLQVLRRHVHSAPGAPLPALEMLLAEVLAIHFCSDWTQTVAVLRELLAEVSRRIREGDYVLAPDSVRVFWVNPVADLRVLNRLEELGGRICGTDYMFTHALELIPEDQPPWTALAQIALADPMVGSTSDRARRVVWECSELAAEAVVICRIPGASHCALEGKIIRQAVQSALGLPTVELEVPPVSDPFQGTLTSRLQALIEVVRARRRP